MTSKRNEAATWVKEVAFAVALGALAAFFCPASVLGKITDPLIASISIILASVIPAVTLTAAAQRPQMDSPLEAQKLGLSLEIQVRFWFAFLITGAVPIGALLFGKALDWELITPRPAYIPKWVPPGSAWLVLLSTSFTCFALIRVRHVPNAVISLVRLGTQASQSQALDRRRQLQNEVAEAIRALPLDKDRGSPISRRDRDVRPSN